MKREWLIDKRNSLGLTQQEVADESNVSRAKTARIRCTQLTVIRRSETVYRRISMR